MADRAADDRVLSAVLSAVAGWPGAAVDPFRGPVQAWGTDWIPVEPQSGPAAHVMAESLAWTTPATRAVADAFAQDSATRKWEQTYARGVSAAMDKMLDGYGFAEIIGPWGPFVSERARVAMVLWGADIVYPAHRHSAEEMYLVVGGSARFTLGEANDARVFDANPGDAVHIPSNTLHGFTTSERPIAILAIWLSTGESLRTASTLND